MTIASVMSVGVILGFGGGAQLLPGVRAGEPGGQAQRVEAAFRDAMHSALFGRKTMGVQPLSKGWEILHYDAAADSWQVTDSSGALNMPLSWSISGLPFPAPETRIIGTEPPIRILGDGRMTSFALQLGTQADARLCSATRLSDLSCQRMDR